METIEQEIISLDQKIESKDITDHNRKKNNGWVKKVESNIMNRNELNNLQPNRYIEAATTNNTRIAYRSDIRHFERWGGLLPASSESIVEYLHQHADKLNSRTLERRLIALRNWHKYQAFPDPTDNPLVKKTLRGIKNIHGQPKDKAPGLTLDQLALMAQHLKAQNTLVACRNNALLQVSFFGAFRRSELIGIQFEHLKVVPEGCEIIIPRSKTDQTGEGLICALPYGNDTLCPVTALKEWLEKSQIKEGPIFRRIDKQGILSSKGFLSRTVCLIIKSVAKECNIPNADKFSGHSLRRGFATSASQQNAPMHSIMRQGRWRHQGTVLGYIEEGNRFNENAASILLHTKKS